jgi:hypothetical protein
MLLQQEAILRRDQEWLHLTSSLLAVASGEGGGSAGDFEYNNVTGRETVVPYFLKGICDESSSWTYHIGSRRNTERLMVPNGRDRTRARVLRPPLMEIDSTS